MAKQAVLLIHGIGEQRPMDTLRGFVNAVWTTNTKIHLPHIDANHVWSKPYKLSENFELRRLTTPENTGGLRTDFFEFYWAHMMRGTKVAHVIAWAKHLLLRWPRDVPSHLRTLYYLCYAVFVIALWFIYRAARAQQAGEMLPAWASLLLSLVIVPTALGIVAKIIGDAARYLHVAPQNIQCRHEIRSAGVAVLDKLHAGGYDRIILVGHSLGAVIGYDILHFAWPSYNADPPKAARPTSIALTKLEDLAIQVADGQTVAVPAIQAAQRAYFDELKAHGGQWRVTDFVTVGSPLAHAEILLAGNLADLSTKFSNRELSSCLPTLESTTHDKRLLRRFSYPLPDAARVPHHAAVFGPTRWTNIYFPSRVLIWGDMIGGKQACFGKGVQDKVVKTRHCFGLLSHTRYWTPGNKNTSIDALRSALDLTDGQ